MVTSSQLAFIERFIAHFPDFQSVLVEHLNDNDGELIAYVFLGTVTFWLTNRYLSAPTDPIIQDWVKQIFAFLEQEYLQGDDAVQEIIAVSFVENLPSTGEPGTELRSFLGPTLTAEFWRLNW